MSDIPAAYIAYGAAKVENAKIGFNKLIAEFAGENVVRQITAAGKTELIGTAVKDVLFWGTSGSLWEAYKAVEHIKITPEMAPFLTEEKKQLFKNKLIEILSSL
jgi:hypothetical protein